MDPKRVLLHTEKVLQPPVHVFQIKEKLSKKTLEYNKDKTVLFVVKMHILVTSTWETISGYTVVRSTAV